MRRAQIVLLVVLAMLAAGVVYLAIRNRQPPWLPDDAEHAALTTADRCLVCHGPDGPLPQSERHPVGRDCTRCHVARNRG